MIEKEETKEVQEEQEEETKEEAQEPGNIIISYTLMVPRYWYLTHELLSLSLLSILLLYQPTGSPTPVPQLEIRSGLKLTLNPEEQSRMLLQRELQGLGGLSDPAVIVLEITIQALLEAGLFDVVSVTITDIFNDGSGVLDITYKAILNVSPDTTEQEVQQQAEAQLQEDIGDGDFSTKLDASRTIIEDDNCGDVSCDDLFTAVVIVSTVSIYCTLLLMM